MSSGDADAKEPRRMPQGSLFLIGAPIQQMRESMVAFFHAGDTLFLLIWLLENLRQMERGILQQK